MGPAHPTNVMELWQKRDELAAEQQAKTLVSTLEVLEIIDPPKKRKLTRAQRRAIQAEIDKTKAQIRGLTMKGEMIKQELARVQKQS